MLKRLHLKSKVIHNSKDKRRIKFLGYTGAAVDVSDHGFDAPLVYDLKTLRVISNRLPLKFNHKDDIGETDKIEKNDTRGVRGEGVLSDSPVAVKIQNNADKGLPYEGSMGLDVTKATFERHTGGLTANGRFYEGKHYLCKNAVMDEMTITRSGRDSDTVVHVLSKMELSKIKEAPVAKKKAKVAPRQPTRTSNARRSDSGSTLRREITREVRRELQRTNNSNPRQQRIHNELPKITMGQALKLNNSYPDYSDMIAESVDANWSFKRLENALRLKTLEDGLPTPPSLPGEDEVDDLEVRLVHTLSRQPEITLEKQYGEEVRDRIMNMDHIGIREMMVIGAQRLGKRFSGFSDIDDLTEFIGKSNLHRINNESGFSSFNMPNLFKRVTQIVVEESWKLEDFFATAMCPAVNQTNFKKTERYRPSGGQMWEGLDANGRIKHAYFGKEHRYETSLDTKAQMVMFNRQTVENDDFSVIQDLIKLMAEGAEMVPDYKLIQHMYQPNGTFFIATPGALQNSFQLALTVENLDTVYESLQHRTIDKGRVDWKQKISDDWWLVIPDNLAMEKRAFEILAQEKIISNTSVTGPVGEKNFWYQRLTVKMFAQLSNSTFHSMADVDNWFLWPKKKQNAPFNISYLRGRKRPIMKTVDAPVDMLGFGIVGVFDNEVNDVERFAIARSIPTATTS